MKETEDKYPMLPSPSTVDTISSVVAKGSPWRVGGFWRSMPPVVVSEFVVRLLRERPPYTTICVVDAAVRKASPDVA
jgi:hypothetical protein